MSRYLPRASHPLLFLAAAALLVFNLLDGVFTLIYVQTGAAVEANPLMGQAMGNPVVFMAVKLALVSLGVLLLWRHQARRLAAGAMVVGAIAYYTLILYHCTEVHRLLDALY